MAQIYASKTNEIQKYETEHENEVRHLAGEHAICSFLSLSS